MQFPAHVPGKEPEDDKNSWATAIHIGDPDDFWLLALAWHSHSYCGHLKLESVVENIILYLSPFLLVTCISNKQINVKIGEEIMLD